MQEEAHRVDLEWRQHQTSAHPKLDMLASGLDVSTANPPAPALGHTVNLITVVSAFCVVTKCHHIVTFKRDHLFTCKVITAILSQIHNK